MRTRRIVFATALGLSAIVGSPQIARTLPAPPPSHGDAPTASQAPPHVALLVTAPGALHTSLYVAAPGDSKPLAPVATFTHLAGATARGATLPGTSTVLATADTAETRDLSFNASLFRVTPHTPPEILCDRVVHASRPLVTVEGRVFVARGMAGEEPKSAKLSDMRAAAAGGRSPDAARVDALSIDEVDPMTGALRTVHSMSGYLTFLAGSYGPEILVYRISPSGADIVAIDPDSSAVRSLVPSLPPFARDFSVDPTTGTLVFQGRHETDSRTWTIESVDLVTGARTRLRESPSMNMVPHALHGGSVAWSPDGREGLSILGGAKASAPLGSGADWVLADSEDGQWVAGLHTVQGALPVPFVIDIASGQASILRAPEGSRVAVAGFVPAEGGAQ